MNARITKTDHALIGKALDHYTAKLKADMPETTANLTTIRSLMAEIDATEILMAKMRPQETNGPRS